MKFYISFLFATLCTASLTAQEVQEITSMKQFKEVIGTQQKPVVLMFYAPWCNACKEMKEQLNQAARILGPQALVAKLNVEQKNLSEAVDFFCIEAIPTLVIKHTGRVEANNLVASLQSLSKKPSLKQKAKQTPQKAPQKKAPQKKTSPCITPPSKKGARTKK